MSEKVPTQPSPRKITLEAGKKYGWCTCAQSSKKPMCDGAHKPLGKAPLVFTVEEDKEAWICDCGATKKPPYCDGTHKSL